MEGDDDDDYDDDGDNYDDDDYDDDPAPLGMEVPEGEEPLASHCCLVAIGRLQTSSVPNTSDLIGPQSNAEFITR